jgi:hypothetical protein
MLVSKRRTGRIASMHFIEILDTGGNRYALPVTSVADVPRKGWFDLMAKCGGHISWRFGDRDPSVSDPSHWWAECDICKQIGNMACDAKDRPVKGGEVSTQKIGYMHMIEIVDDDKNTYTMPVAAVRDVPRQEWFDLMAECGGHVTINRPYDCKGRYEKLCPICAVAEDRKAATETKFCPGDKITEELLGWLDQIAAQGMSFRARLMKNRGEG